MIRDGAWRRARLAHSVLYLCTDRRAPQGDLAAFVSAALRGGVDLVQLRDKEGTPDQLVAAGMLLREAAQRHDALFIVNDDPELAVRMDADGVHVGQEDPLPDAARAIVGPQRLVGRSTHAVAEIDRALEEDCDYFAIGPVEATPTKHGRAPVGLEPVRYAAAVADRPWFVTGNMGPATIPPAMSAGMRGAVVVRALTGADDPQGVARHLSTLLRQRPDAAPSGPGA